MKSEKNINIPRATVWLISVAALLFAACQTGHNGNDSVEFDYAQSMGYYQLKGTASLSGEIGKNTGQHVQVLSLKSHLDVPWEIRYENGRIWYSLQGGDVYHMSLQTGAAHRVLSLPGVMRKRTMGSLGMAIDSLPGLIQVYFIYNTVIGKEAGIKSVKVGSAFETQLVRYDYDKKSDTLTNRHLVFEWPASTSHNGARILIGRENDLYITTGDLEDNNNAQDTGSLNGKVLRIMKDGSIPRDNPFKGSYVWTYGHRNSQGICYGPGGLIYASEHGDAIEDEVNLIQKGRNYGWPLVEGKVDQPAEIHKVDSLGLTIMEPMLSWTPTIAPASIIYYNKGEIKAFENSLLLVTLKGNALYVLHLDKDGRKITGQDVYFQHFFGRLRSICRDENGRVYIGTSNRDWNPGPGYPKAEDDHILMITSELQDTSNKNIDSTLFKSAFTVVTTGKLAINDKGEDLFINYCSSCHKPDGDGIAGTFPPLNGNSFLKDNKELIAILQNGRNGTHEIMGKNYTQSMPSFSFLTNAEMLQLVNYLKGQFMHAPEIDAALLQQLRKKATLK